MRKVVYTAAPPNDSNVLSIYIYIIFASLLATRARYNLYRYVHYTHGCASADETHTVEEADEARAPWDLRVIII